MQNHIHKEDINNSYEATCIVSMQLDETIKLDKLFKLKQKKRISDNDFLCRNVHNWRSCIFLDFSKFADVDHYTLYLCITLRNEHIMRISISTLLNAIQCASDAEINMCELEKDVKTFLRANDLTERKQKVSSSAVKKSVVKKRFSSLSNLSQLSFSFALRKNEVINFSYLNNHEIEKHHKFSCQGISVWKSCVLHEMIVEPLSLRFLITRSQNISLYIDIVPDEKKVICKYPSNFLAISRVDISKEVHAFLRQNNFLQSIETLEETNIVTKVLYPALKKGQRLCLVNLINQQDYTFYGVIPAYDNIPNWKLCHVHSSSPNLLILHVTLLNGAMVCITYDCKETNRIFYTYDKSFDIDNIGLQKDVITFLESNHCIRGYCPPPVHLQNIVSDESDCHLTQSSIQDASTVLDNAEEQVTDIQQESFIVVSCMKKPKGIPLTTCKGMRYEDINVSNSKTLDESPEKSLDPRSQEDSVTSCNTIQKKVRFCDMPEFL